MKKIISDEQQLKILADIVAINTVNANEASLAAYFSKFFQQYNIKTKEIKTSIPGRSNLVAEIGNAGPIIGFAGRIRFMLTVNEEQAQAGAKQLSKLGYADDLSALVIAEPTGVRIEHLEAYLTSGGVNLTKSSVTEVLANISAQQKEQHFALHAHKGFLAYDVLAKGKAAHSSTPAAGVDAIAQIVNYYQAESDLYDSFTQSNLLLGKTIRGANILRGGIQANSIAGEAKLSELTRIIPELPAQTLANKLNQLVTNLNQQNPSAAYLELLIKDMGAAMISPAEAKIVLAGQDTAKIAFPNESTLPTLSASMGTDASRFAAANPNLTVLILGPGNDTAHQENEYVEKASFLSMADYYYTLAYNFLT
ncbi:succinyl-diaminopimelate desuccinylase [Weissella oryzae SG25]|uniref:Succinyl-diaminopimelate desuccinylase n=2 Tax=Weissella TaxID=46255 RepID=A0A069CS96_WEIOS|nr:succinyl-diaminopimelate desuccinylase [Weissella oryzae SG25]